MSVTFQKYFINSIKIKIFKVCEKQDSIFLKTVNIMPQKKINWMA